MTAAIAAAPPAQPRHVVVQDARLGWFMPLVRALWGTANDQRAEADIEALAAARASSLRLKPRLRIRPDGWVSHSGGAFPFDPRTPVEVRHAREGLSFVDQPMPAAHWPESWWHGLSASWRNNIIAFRIVGEVAA